MAPLYEGAGFKSPKSFSQAFPDKHRVRPRHRCGRRPADLRLPRILQLGLLCLSAGFLFPRSAPAAMDRVMDGLPGDSLTEFPGTGFGMPGHLQDGPIDPDRYVLGPGDELVLSVLGRVSMSSRLRVDPEGILWIQDLGPLRVGGLTLRQARDRLIRMFGGASRGLEVYLGLTRLRRFTVYVDGEVRRPGTIEGAATMRASEAIELAGGLTPQGSRRAVVLRSPGDSLRSVDLVRFSRLGDLGANPTLLDGDHLFVPKRTRPVYLYGPVSYPGEYEYRAGDRLSELVRLAGGFREEALLDQAQVLRFIDDRRSDTLAVDLGAIVGGSDDLALEEGDRVYVPSRSEYHEDRHVTVTGEVARPGVYPLREGAERVSDLLGSAGGLTETAARNGILVVRAGPSALERDPEFDRLSRLSRNEMTDAEYQVFRTKLAAAQHTFPVDYAGIANAERDGGDGAKREAGVARDVRLRSGDVLFVDRISQSVRLAGEVRRPGLVAFEPGRRGAEYIRLAGGFTSKAKRNGTRLTRFATGQTLSLKDAREVEPGDLIYVPDRPDVHALRIIRDSITFAAAVATVVIAIRR
jgi:polysaccharide biosynthesis/export protein